MKLKELHIFGFKSFADKTSLQFGQDITIVVGPNGSGKSNIFDAIRWVLGEQSAKSLRGGKMEDVIFIGSDSRKTLGMAEVSIVMDNSDKSINLNYNEVKVTRRLYRSGESEYYINDQQVRLKDIVETFMDTGVGLDSYSIISQGEVDKIINAKPSERREIFEEAAGITKYIKKRDEGMRKLEATEQNMLRINDILVEVKRQTSVLERQAKKAEQYKVLKQECSDMEIKMLKKEIKERTLKNRDYHIKKADIDGRMEAEEAGLAKFEQEFEGMRYKNLEMERDLAEKREKWVIKQEEIKRLEDSLKYLAEKHTELLSRIEISKNENVENVGKIEGVKLEIEYKNKEIIEKEGIIKDREAQLDNLNKRYEVSIADFELAKKDRDAKSADVDKHNEEFNNLKGRIVELELNMKNIEDQLVKLDAQKKEATDRLHRTEVEMQSIIENKILKEDEIKSIKDKEESLLMEKMRRKASLVIVEETLKELGLVISRLESRQNLLKQMQEKMEGYGDIVRKVLTEYKLQLEDESKSDLVDVVANLIDVDKPYEKVVEKTLAGLLQTVLIRNEKLIDEIFTLYELEKGEISFINSNNMHVSTNAVLASWKESVVHENIIAYLPEKIEIESGNEAIKLLFSNIFLVENMEKAKEVLEKVKKTEQFFLLTLNGELLSNYNIYTKVEGLAGDGFLSRDREIEEINSEIQTAKGKYTSIEEERNLQSENIAQMEREIENLSVSYHTQYVEVIKDDERMKQKNEDLERHATAIKHIDQENAQLAVDMNIFVTGREALLIEGKRSTDIIDNCKKLVEEARQLIVRKEEGLNSEKTIIDDKKLEIVTLKNDYEFGINNRTLLWTRLTEVEAGYANTVLEIEGLNLKVLQAEDESRQNAVKIEVIKSSMKASEDGLEQSKKTHEEFKVIMLQTEDKIKQMSKTRDHLKDELYDIKILINDMVVQIANFFEKLNIEFKITPDENEVISFEIAEDEYKELNVKVSEFREKIDKLGVINLVAIEEYNELKSRNEHLQLQYNDLMSARENLKKIIKKANEESKELFIVAFEAIRIKFADVFKKMFNGGEADLFLSDGSDVLESGIDIIARPPGKKSQTISLLSGGEKAITAVSLLFALFLTKASPFCVMDEIDAPLDDVNVTRFTNLLKSFKATQFIIISHNKLTMEVGDVLYGVTMEKAGVSQIISVKMDQDKDRIKQILSKDGKSAALKESEKRAEEAKEIAEVDAVVDGEPKPDGKEDAGDGEK